MGIAHDDRFRITWTVRYATAALVILSSANVAALAVHEAPTTTAAPIKTDEAASPPPSEVAPTTTVAPTSTSKPGASRAKATSTSVSAVPQETVPTLPLVSEGLDYEVVINPPCAKVGQVISATVRLKPKPGSAASLMPFYADGSREDGTAEIAKPDGTVTYSWVAKNVPGEGRLATQAHDPETREFGTKIVAFRIIEVNKSC
jgi:hypothetical protein